MKLPKPGRLLLFWDYDTQWGADRSRSSGGPKAWGDLEFTNTERLLQLLAEYRVPSCFAVVAAAARPGERPYHDPAQIRAIHSAGHEVASHSLHHEWLPGLNPVRLQDTLLRSREVLEDCIGAPVKAFVPPYNQPFDYPAALSFSRSERREAGPQHTGFAALCRTLYQTGFRFCRAAYRPMPQRLIEALLHRNLDAPGTVKRVEGVSCLRLNAGCGFDSHPQEMVRRCSVAGGYVVLYGHPHSLSADCSQSFAHLEKLLGLARDLVEQRKLEFALPRDLVRSRESGSAEKSYAAS